MWERITDFDIVELNEAFASQVLAVLRQLGISDDASYVNANGAGESLTLGAEARYEGAMAKKDYNRLQVIPVEHRIVQKGR